MNGYRRRSKSSFKVLCNICICNVFNPIRRVFSVRSLVCLGSLSGSVRGRLVCLEEMAIPAQLVKGGDSI